MASSDNIGLNGIVAGVGISLYEDNRSDNHGEFVAKAAGTHSYSLSISTSGVTLISPVVDGQYLDTGYYYIDAAVSVSNYNSSSASTSANFYPRIIFGDASITGHSKYLSENDVYTWNLTGVRLNSAGTTVPLSATIYASQSVCYEVRITGYIFRMSTL